MVDIIIIIVVGQLNDENFSDQKIVFSFPSLIIFQISFRRTRNIQNINEFRRCILYIYIKKKTMKLQ